MSSDKGMYLINSKLLLVSSFYNKALLLLLSMIKNHKEHPLTGVGFEPTPPQ